MTAPTEEDVRAAVARAWKLDKNPITVMISPETALDEMLNTLKGLTDHLHDFHDMRESEIDRMDVIYAEEFVEVLDLVDQLGKVAVEATVRAAHRFFTEYPDAPWRRPEPIPAGA